MRWRSRSARESITNNSKNLNRTRLHPPITDFRSERLRQRMLPSANLINLIKHYHPRNAIDIKIGLRSHRWCCHPFFLLL
jgi:hypothetical protein